MSSFVFAMPEECAAASADLTSLGSSIQQAYAVAAGSTTQILPAAQDEVSAAISVLFGNCGQELQSLSAQVARFHNQFVQAVNGGGFMYAGTEAAAASVLQRLLSPINAPVQAAAGGCAGQIYQAIQRFNEKLLITFTNVVGGLEQPLARILHVA